MQLRELDHKIFDAVKGRNPGDGLCWAGCAGEIGSKANSYILIREAAHSRIISKLPGIDASNDIKFNDEQLYEAVRQWKPTATLHEVTKTMDDAVAKVMGEVAKEYTLRHNNEPASDKTR